MMKYLFLSCARIAAVLIIFTCIACSSKEQNLKRDVTMVKRCIARAGTDVAYAMSFQSILEMGGSFSSYVIANLPENAKYPAISDGKPKEAWSIAIIDDPDNDEIVIEGYGEDLSKPIIVERVGFPKRVHL